MVHYTYPCTTAYTTGIGGVSPNCILSRPCFDYPCYRLMDHHSSTNSASCIHIYPLPSVRYVLHIICKIPPMMLMDFTAYIIFPCFLSLHQLFGSLLPHQVYHHMHVSHMWTDCFSHLIHQGYFTIFVLGVSDKSVPVHESHTSIIMVWLFICCISCHSKYYGWWHID